MNELRLALRSLRNRPLFAVVAIVTLALGIGATTTLFTIVNAVLLRPLPYPDAGRIVSISEAEDGKDGEVAPVPEFFAYRAARAMTSLAMIGGTSRVVRTGGSPTRISGESVSASFFSVFAARPMLGRVFRPDEDLPDGPSVVVLSHDLWQQFGGDSSIVGRTVALDDQPVTVVGVMPPGFAAPRAARFWVPMQMDSVFDAGIILYTQIVGRLRPGVRLADAQTELATILSRLPAPPTAPGAAAPPQRSPVVMTLHERMFGATRPALLLLLGAVAFLLLIACANVANLLLARGAARQREFAVRVALGASRWRLARQLLWESVAVSVIGGGIGLLIPVWSLGFFVRLSPASVARVEDIHVDAQVLLFAAALSVITGIVFGLIPALGATRPDNFRSLKEGGARTTGTAAQRRIRQGLVVAELSTALVLLTGAGLLARSFARAVAVDLGFRPDHTVIVNTYLTRSGYPTQADAQRFFDRFATQLRAVPGVRVVGYADAPILSGYRMVVHLPPAAGRTATTSLSVVRVSADYLTAQGAELVAGRLMDARDQKGAPPAVVLSASAAHDLFPDGSAALGRTIPALEPGSPTPTVVGIVKDVQEPGADAPRLPTVYQAMAQEPDVPSVVVARFAGDDVRMLAAVRRITAGFDPLQVSTSISTVQQQLDGIVAPRKLNSAVVEVFAALALVLAAVGLYGVMAYQVTQRTQEFGIRMALGANRARVLRFVLRDGMGLAVLGTALGLVLSLGLSRFLAGMLFDVSPRDPLTFVAVPGTLLLVALVACYLPARRATKVDPMVALRYE